MSNSQKNFLSIRSKLIAAVAMLLVASFMVVSSTYAWFTLSTAPEVTGITTQIGANGNLEIALNTTGNEPTNANGGVMSLQDKNITWGNIIDLGEGYALNTISLKPSRLGVTNDGKIDLRQPLWTPVYGSDGRVSEIKNNGVFGSVNDSATGFVQQAATGGYGVRALGTISSMTEQQFQFNAATTALNTSLSLANSYAYTSITKVYDESTGVQIGGALVSLILKGALDSGSGFTEADLAPLQAMITELSGAPTELKNAVKNFMILAIAKKAEQQSDANFKLIMSAFKEEWDDIYDELGDEDFNGTLTFDPEVSGVDPISVELGSGAETLKTVVQTINRVATNLGTAQTKYNDALTDGDVTWDEIKLVLSPLMDIDAIKVNGKTYAQIMTGKNAPEGSEDAKAFGSWAYSVVRDGVEIEMTEGSGVYADIASVTKNVDINFKPLVTVEYGSIVLEDEPLDVRMFTNITAVLALDKVTMPSPESREAGDESAVITDTYAYVLDFVFRTNAKDSFLQLQTEAVDRIYSEDPSPTTMGKGSYMEIATSVNFGETDVKNLMDNIRLVFVDTKDGTIYAGGKLNTTAPMSGSSVKAPIELYTLSVVDGMLDWDNATKMSATEQNIVSLSQNESTYISVFVYLDGDDITNADVPAAEDLFVDMNLQFSSSAELKPMEYSSGFGEVEDQG